MVADVFVMFTSFLFIHNDVAWVKLSFSGYEVSETGRSLDGLDQWLAERMNSGLFERDDCGVFDGFCKDYRASDVKGIFHSRLVR
jgi:hypothetical protein